MGCAMGTRPRRIPAGSYAVRSNRGLPRFRPWSGCLKLLTDYIVLAEDNYCSDIYKTIPSCQALAETRSVVSLMQYEITDFIIAFGCFASPQASSQNRDLAESACGESGDYRFMPCRPASDLLHRPVSYTPSAVARLCVSFLSHPPSRKVMRAGLSHSLTSQTRGRALSVHPRCFAVAGVPPTFTSLGPMADAEEQNSDQDTDPPSVNWWDGTGPRNMWEAIVLWRMSCQIPHFPDLRRDSDRLSAPRDTFSYHLHSAEDIKPAPLGIIASRPFRIVFTETSLTLYLPLIDILNTLIVIFTRLQMFNSIVWMIGGRQYLVPDYSWYVAVQRTKP
ncbi:hypothetical protein AG1IA_08031 [Rhizoctonia solani AG-1 IA]|uniref:Uncharacterized protein n=1 Tax=Thanatephorus cucumeris (strain AG1-IA) TaxID=983506 RepID=L8WIA4_THACA|nr:hypothetical protein AG1IA_08031 [Rhizoctonia solani AG-1 IA]